MSGWTHGRMGTRIYVPKRTDIRYDRPASKAASQTSVKKYPPTAQELREWMDKKGLSNKDVAKALRLSDGRVVRFWTSKKDPRPIPYASWYTLRHKFGKEGERRSRKNRKKSPKLVDA